jgi:O-antigen/teichoic acid export membrane protein
VVAVVTAAASAVYVFVLDGGALGVVGAQLTGATAGLGAGLWLARGAFTLAFDWGKAKTMLLYSIPLVPSSVGVLLNGYADRLALQHERSLAAVGLYGVGFRVAVVVSLLIAAVQNAITPQVLRRHRNPETRVELARALRLFWCLGCLTFVVLSVLAEPLVRLLASPAYFGGSRVVPLLVPAAFLAGVYVFAPGPVIAGRMRAFAAVNIASGAINLGLAFALVPAWGIVGAGIATLTSSAMACIAMLALSQRLYRAPHDWQRLASGTAVAIAVVVVARTLMTVTRSQSLASGPLLARIAVCAVGSLLVASVLIDWRGLVPIVSRVRRRGAEALPPGSARR